MEELTHKFEGISEKVRKVLEKCDKLERYTRALEEENYELKNDLQTRMDQIVDLEANLKTLKIAKGTYDDDQDRKELKLKINEYIREIDRCIALLNE